ncbi:MAG: Rpn family recombination-promoting nuclease/putative transposase [Cyanosarcina radialis HA8281-LM2]|nr:Rpn family recombination-promoting nuclease/putative transposase [Cyanosarcina radialis HA8281-LM2]
MKTDSIFYRLFKDFPQIFWEIIGNSPNRSDSYQFSSVEIKQTAFRIDGVFLPIDDRELPIYFVEVQMQPDQEFYSRLFAEICLYIRHNKPQNDWRSAIIYPSQSADTGDIRHSHEFFASQRVRRIYLDELGEATSLPLGISTVKLVVEAENIAKEKAQELIGRIRQEIEAERQQQELLELIETILVYKFPKMTRKEIETMFGLSDLKQTRVYQEAKEEGREEAKLASIPRLLALGLSVPQIAEVLELDVAIVQQAAKNLPSK